MSKHVSKGGELNSGTNMASPATSILGMLALVGAVYLATDPLSLSPIKGVKNFKIQSVPLPPKEALDAIPRDNENKLQSSEIKFGGQIFGPESVTFDPQGRGPYAGVGDGRVMRWDGDEAGWVEFAVIIPNRTEICNQPQQPLRANLEYEHLCGRPLGLRFNKQTGFLYIADAYFGLLKVGPEGGLAELLTSTADDGQKFVFTNDLDIDDDGTVYFTDSSSKYPRRNFVLAILEAESGGRLLKWDPKTTETTVLVRNLRFPNGVSFSKDHSFLLVAETGILRVSRYWVKGPKAGTYEHFAWLAGYPDNLRTNDKGEFWVALHSRRTFVDGLLKPRPALKQALLKLPISLGMISGKPHGALHKFNEQGELLDVLEDQTGAVVRLISEPEEHDGKLYLGSVLLPHVAVYTLPM